MRAEKWRWIALSAALTALAVYPPKKIWIDEVAHFAIGAFDRFGDAWNAALHAIRVSYHHNQTGVHMLVDWGMMRLFGASAFWMRFPSLLSLFWILLAAGIAFRRWGLPARWRVFGALFLGLHYWIREFAYEARPYLPFAAGMIGTWVFFTATAAERARKGFRLFGGASLLLASTVHPYFGPYFGVLVLYALCLHRREPLRARVEWIWSLAALALYAAVALLTWKAISKPSFALNPFEWIGSGTQGLRIFFSAHLLSLTVTKIPFFCLLLACAALSRRLWRSEAGQWFALAFACSLALSVVSYWKGYWILQRQWIASLALVGISIGAVAHVIEQWLPRRSLRIAFQALCWGGLAYGATEVLPHAARGFLAGPPPPPDHASLARMGEVEALLGRANLNASEGGPVSSRFRLYYGWPDPEEPLFRR